MVSLWDRIRGKSRPSTIGAVAPDGVGAVPPAMPADGEIVGPRDATAISETRLAVTTVSPITGLEALRELWHDAGCEAIAPLETPPGQQATLDGHTFQILWGAGELASVLDTRLRRDDRPIGRGFVGFHRGAPELARFPGAQVASLWGFGPRGDARALLSLVERLAHHTAAVTGVVQGCADRVWLSTDHWLRTLGPPGRRNVIPVQAFVDVAFGPAVSGVRRLTTYGMYRGLGLPDIEVDDPRAEHDDARYELCFDVAVAACRVLVGEDAQRGAAPEQTFPAGKRVTVSVGERRAAFRVLGDAGSEHPTLRIGELAWI